MRYNARPMDGTQVDAPPCVRLGEPMNWCAKRQMAERLLGHFALVEEWKGWRFAGRDLVSPDGYRINPTRLRCLLYAEKRSTGAAKKPAAAIHFLFAQD